MTFPVFVISPTTSTGEFPVILGPLYDRFAEAMCNPNSRDAEKVKDWEVVFRVSWLGTRAEGQEFGAWETAIKEYSDGFSSRLSGMQSSLFSSPVHWFLLELALTATVKYRKGLFSWDNLDKLSKRPRGHRLDIDLQIAGTSFREVEDIETVA